MSQHFEGITITRFFLQCNVSGEDMKSYNDGRVQMPMSLKRVRKDSNGSMYNVRLHIQLIITKIQMKVMVQQIQYMICTYNIQNTLFYIHHFLATLKKNKRTNDFHICYINGESRIGKVVKIQERTYLLIITVCLSSITLS